MIMEPVLESLLLHPALLIVSGFESITSEDVRFLNGYRVHFEHNGLDRYATNVYSDADFELGGILNPAGSYFTSRYSTEEVMNLFPTYPYLTISDIWHSLYAPKLKAIFNRLLHEVFQNLSRYSVEHKRPVSFFQAQTAVIRALEQSPCYAQIAALHMCGLGDKLGLAFDWIFSKYRIYEERIRLNQAAPSASAPRYLSST